VLGQSEYACLHKTVSMVVFFVKNNENTYPKESTHANVQSCPLNEKMEITEPVKVDSVLSSVCNYVYQYFFQTIPFYPPPPSPLLQTWPPNATMLGDPSMVSTLGLVHRLIESRRQETSPELMVRLEFTTLYISCILCSQNLNSFLCFVN